MLSQGLHDSPVKSQNVFQASQGNGHSHRPARHPHGYRKVGRGKGKQSHPRVPSPLGITLHVLVYSFPSKEAELWQCPSCQGKYSDLVGLTGFPSVLPFLFSDNARCPSIFFLPLPPSPPGPHWLPNWGLGYLRVERRACIGGGSGL